MLPTTCPHPWGGLEELRPVLWRRLRPRCRDDHETDDLIQETFLRAARYRTTLHDPEKLRSWLLRIARNVQRDHLRRERRYRSAEAGEELLERIEGREEVPGDLARELQLEIDRHPIEREVALGHLEPALLSLRAHDRTLLEAFYHRAEGVRTAAIRIDVAPSTVKVRLFRARQRLRRAVGRALARERTALLLAEEVRA